MNALPHTSDELLERLFTIFPRFRDVYSGPFHDGPSSYHSVLMGFNSDFSADLSSQPEDQRKSFAALINDSVAESGSPDSLENAFGTVYLEHLHQLNHKTALWPYLSPVARRLTQP